MNKNEAVAEVKRQVAEIFYNDVRGFLDILKMSRGKFAPGNPMAMALSAVMDADAEGRIEDHIKFDGETMTHLSKEGNIVMQLYVKFKEQFDPGSVQTEPEAQNA